MEGLPAVRQVAGGSSVQCELSLVPGIQARFEAFHRDDPHVYRHLVYLAREHVRSEFLRALARLLEAHDFNAPHHRVVRWRMFVKTKGAEFFKLNDHFTSRYARLIEDREPDLRGLFRHRHLQSN